MSPVVARPERKGTLSPRKREGEGVRQRAVRLRVAGAGRSYVEADRILSFNSREFIGERETTNRAAIAVARTFPCFSSLRTHP